MVRNLRSLNRRLTRHATRMAGGGPRPRAVNHLAHALLAFQKAIRARRRLMRLAPHVFDSAVVDREAAAQAQAAVIQAGCEEALTKIYGPAAPSPPIDAPSTDAPTSVLCPPLSPWPRSRRTRQAIARAMDAHELWFEMGQVSFRQFQTKQPHVRLGLSTIARMLSVGEAWGRLATGLDTTSPKDPGEDEGRVDFRTALQRIYGERELTDAEA